jgi:hypothetical protein
MRKNILLGPTGQVESCAVGKEIETGLRDFEAALTFQSQRQFVLQPVQVAHIARRIVFLCFG